MNEPQNGRPLSLSSDLIEADRYARPLKRRDEDSEEPSQGISTMANALRRVWRIALPLGLVFSVLGAGAAWWLFEPKFSATAYLRVDADNRPLIFKTADEAASRGSDFKLYKNTQQQMLLTPFVLNAALRDPQVSGLPEITQQPDAIAWLQKNLQIKFPADGEIMHVSFESVSPSACVEIVNGVVNAFMKEVVVEERNQKLNRLNNLEQVYSDAEGKVRNKQGELKSLAAALGTSDTESLTVAQQTALQQFGKMQENLSSIQFDLMQAEGELNLAQDLQRRQSESNVETPVEAGPSAEELEMAERTPDILRLEDEVATLQSQYNSMSTEVGAGHPTLRKIKQDLDSKSELLAKRKVEAKSRAKLMAEQKVKDLQKQQILRTPGGPTYDLVAIATRVELLRKQEKNLQEKVDQLANETRQLGRSSIDVELMRSEIESSQDVLRRVGEEIERTSIELKTSSRIRLLSSAVTATPPDIKKRITRAAALGFAGFAAPFGLMILWDLTRKRVNNVDGVSQALSLPTIGTIPMVGKKSLRREAEYGGRVIDRERLQLEEAIDGLASMILHSALIEKRQVFMISSAMPSEGKSTVACQLAQSLAKSGKRVALVDFDLRRPSVHTYLDLNLTPGLSEVLYDDIELDEAMQTLSNNPLEILAAGRWSGHLSERCNSGSVTRLFDSLRSHYDLVIVDACPILPVHEARVVGKFTDGVILTLVRDRSRLPLAAQACEILRSFGIPVLGTVVIGGSSTGYSDYYHPYGATPKSRPKIEART